MKRKYFVLRSTSSSGPARLEYHDTEKKYSLGHQAKRVIHLHTCFNINRKSDSRHRHAIALYTKEECFSVVCEDEKEQERWLDLMLQYQNEFLTEGEKGRQHYDFVWQVTIQAKGLGQTMNIRGSYRLCLTWHSLYLFKLNMDKPHYVFQLETVRSVGHMDNVFKLILGKIAPTGEGELFMQSDDTIVTKNIHETVVDFMRERDKRQNGYDSQRSFSESLHGSASSLPRPPPEFRHRSETFTPGSSNRIRPRVERPMSVCTRAARSTSHIHNAVSPGSSPHIHGFMDSHGMEAHRLRSNSNDSKVTRPTFTSAPCDDLLHDHHSLRKIRPAVQEEPDLDISLGLDDSSDLTSPGTVQLDWDEGDGQGGECYMDMNPGTATPPTPSNRGYMDMAPAAQKGGGEMVKEGGRPEAGSTYMAMTSTRSCSAPIPIHPIHPGHPDHGYLEMTSHSVLPPVKEGGSSEGYVPMSSPPYNTGSYTSDSSELKPDRVRCMLSDDGNDFSQPPQRTYSLGSRPVKTGPPLSIGYMDMTGGAKKVSDNGRSCSAPHLVHPLPLPHHRSGRSSNLESPTPSASPLSMSLKSDDSDAFMELDFYRPRTASDSYSYRPCASSFGMPHSAAAQSHRPRSSSHGQGTRPLRRHKMLAECMGRLNHEAVLRSHNASQGSLDSLRVSSSESLKKLSQEVLSKTSQLNASGYMDMSGDKRFTPSPQPLSTSSQPSEREGYVDMTLGKRDGYMDMSAATHRSPHGLRPSSDKAGDRAQEGDSAHSSLGTSAPGRDSVYVNFDSPDGLGKKESPPRPSPSEYPDTYMMYEPATPTNTSGASGKENVPDSCSPKLKERSGSGKEGKKRGGLFSLRHGQGDSGKHTSKKSEPSQQNSGVPYATTGGQQFGSLGRDFRKKSKDLSKAARQKSSSFSKTFGISASKPGKLLRKSPTPPSSLDGNDEYIEFTPAAAKSDSDSSHSSGSFKVARGRPEAIPAQQEAAYVGFEPGTIPAASCSQRGPAIAASSSSSYMNMGGGSQGKVFTVIKPTKKSGAKRSKSGEDCSLGVAALPPAWECGRPVDSQGPVAGPLLCSHPTTPAQPVPVPQSASHGKSALVRPQAVYPPQGPAPVGQGADTTLKSGPAGSAQSSESEPAPPVVVQVKDCVCVPGQSSIAAVPSAAPCSTGEGVQCGAPSVTQPGEGHGLVPQCSVPECPFPALFSTVLSRGSSSSPSCCPLSSSSTQVSSHQASLSPQSDLPPTVVDHGDYMHFDPAKPGGGMEGCAVVPPRLEDLCAGVTSCVISLHSSSGSMENNSLSSRSGDSAPAVSSSCRSPISSDSPQSVWSSPTVTVGRMSSGSEGRSRRRSGSRMSTSGTQAGGDCVDTVCEQSGGNGLCTGGTGTVAPSTAGVETCSTSAEGQTPSPGNRGLMVLDSGSAVTASSGGRGRGRHNSSGSVGIAQSAVGRTSGSVSGPDPGMGPINSGTDTRHSISDLTGCQQTPFPSNALSQQLPSLPSDPLSHLPLSGSGSILSDSQGGLNYAKLDLSSADSLGDSGEGVRSPRNRSRHSSAAEEKVVPRSYATIDFEKSESLRSNTNKDVKLIL